MQLIMVSVAKRRRIYDSMLTEHLAAHRQMASVSGPRQVGKTTTCRNHPTDYLNWDNVDDREQVLAGPATLAATALRQLRELSDRIPLDKVERDVATGDD